MENQVRTGKVKFFDKKNNFGFIIDDETNKEYYVHRKATNFDISDNDNVQFELTPGKRGDECINVKKIK